MTTPEQGSPQPEFVIEETVSTRAIEALMGNYRTPQEAFQELIDNAVDNRIPDKPLVVRIRAIKNELSVSNQGGSGLDREGLQNFFVWGFSNKTIGKQIGFRGVGGKSAMGYLGRSMEVVVSAQGSDEQYRVFDPNWESRAEGEWRKYTPEITKATSNEGYFRLKVTNLKREINPNLLSQALANFYRPLLMDGSVKIFVNNKEVEPVQIKMVSDDANLRPEAINTQTRLGDSITVIVGVLEPGQSIKPGIRCYYNGRLIEEEQFFGQPTPSQLPQMARLIGEAHMDTIPVTTNKNGFDKGSTRYVNAAKRLNVLLEPWVQKVSKLKIEQQNSLEAFERDLAKKAKRVLEQVFANTGIVTKSMLPGGESSDRRPPTKKEEAQPVIPSGKPGGHGPQEGQTAPVLDATIGEMRRWGALVVWEPLSLGSYGKRADIVIENNRHILKINIDDPRYQAAKKAGEEALQMYMADTGSWMICELVTKDRTREEFMDLYDRASRETGAIFQGIFKEKKETSKRGTARSGTIRFNS